MSRKGSQQLSGTKASTLVKHQHQQVRQSLGDCSLNAASSMANAKSTMATTNKQNVEDPSEQDRISPERQQQASKQHSVMMAALKLLKI